MANIKPFCGIYFNQDKITDISKVICPPYDIISPVAQESYHRLSPYNMIHLEFGRDKPGEDKYKRAEVSFNNWLKEEILMRDKEPAIYFYNQRFTIRGEAKERLGFIALLRLEGKGNTVFPHEHTRLESKEDRFQLIRRVEANLSPIFVLFSDEKRIIRRTYEKYIKDTSPFIEIIDEERMSHKIWRFNSEDALELFQAQMENKNIFIADGHHRYEVALAFREEMKKKLGNLPEEADSSYIMAYFTNIEGKGLSILPIHRLVEGISDFRIDTFKEAVKAYFDIQEIKERDNFLLLLEKAGVRENTLGMYRDKKFYLLRLKNKKFLDKEILDKPKEYRSLDVTILNYIVLKRILGLNLEDKEKIKFNPNTDELISHVDNCNSSVAFFLNPVKIEQLVSIAQAGERMPPKSTYFYPKVYAGLLINKFNI